MRPELLLFCMYQVDPAEFVLYNYTAAVTHTPHRQSSRTTPITPHNNTSGMPTTRGSSSSGASAVDQAGSEQQADPSTHGCGPYEQAHRPGQVRMYRLTYALALVQQGGLFQLDIVHA